MQIKFDAFGNIAGIQKVRRLCYFLLLVFATNNAYSQSYFLPTAGAKWSVSLSSFGGYQCTIKYYYEKDTVMCGYTYAVISNQNQSVCGGNSPLFVRNDNNLIYGRTGSCISNEILYYDFNLNVGDTFIAAANINDTAIVTSISFIPMLNGSIRKHMMLTSIGIFPMQYYWIEGIGDMQKLFYSYNLSDPVFELLCFEDSTGLIYQNTFWNTCDTSSVLGVNEFNRDVLLFEIYPNPSTDKIFIKYEFDSDDIYEVTIFDITGRLIKSIPVYSVFGLVTISADELPKGVLFCTLSKNDTKLYAKKIVKL